MDPMTDRRSRGEDMGPRFGRVITAMVTPFDEKGELDLGAAAELAQWLAENGSDGLVLSGTTGESPTLTESEELVLFRTIRDAVDIPILAGTGSNSTATALEQTKRASEIGVDGVLVVTPYYNRPSQAGLLRYFKDVAAATTLPVMIYDIPARTGRKIDTDTILRLAGEVDNIVALKDAAGDPAETARVIAEAPPGFEVYSGDDSLTLPLLSLGAVGVVSVASHWAGREIAAMIDTFERGEVREAARLNASLIPSFEYESQPDAPNPVPTKAMLRVLGLKVGQCRPPMGPTPEGLEDRARELLGRSK